MFPSNHLLALSLSILSLLSAILPREGAAYERPYEVTIHYRGPNAGGLASEFRISPAFLILTADLRVDPDQAAVRLRIDGKNLEVAVSARELKAFELLSARQQELRLVSFRADAMNLLSQLQLLRTQAEGLGDATVLGGALTPGESIRNGPEVFRALTRAEQLIEEQLQTLRNARNGLRSTGPRHLPAAGSSRDQILFEAPVTHLASVNGYHQGAAGREQLEEISRLLAGLASPYLKPQIVTREVREFPVLKAGFWSSTRTSLEYVGLPTLRTRFDCRSTLAKEDPDCEASVLVRLVNPSGRPTHVAPNGRRTYLSRELAFATLPECQRAADLLSDALHLPRNHGSVLIAATCRDLRLRMLLIQLKPPH